MRGAVRVGGHAGPSRSGTAHVARLDITDPTNCAHSDPWNFIVLLLLGYEALPAVAILAVLGSTAADIANHVMVDRNAKNTRRE